MITSLAAGPQGLEGTWRWERNWLDPSFQIILNDREGAFPRTKFDRITGMYSVGELEDLRMSRVGAIGEIAYPAMMRGKTFTIEGRVQALTLESLRTHSLALRSAFADRRHEGVLEVVAPGETDGWRCVARVLTLDMDDVQERPPTAVPSPWQRSFVMTVRMSDPRWYWHDLFEDGPNASAATRNLDSQGDAPVEPLFLVAGPITDLTLQRGSNPDFRQLVLESVGLAGGQTLAIHFGFRTIYRVSDGVSFASKVVFDESDWWDDQVFGLEPGVTDVTVTGGSWTVQWYPAAW
jgi:hypothetical protein